MTRSRLTGWRKVASALWDAPSDPQIYGMLEIDATPMVAMIKAAREAGQHLTPTHLVGRAVGHALVAVPDLNVRLLGDFAHPRESVDVFFITAVDQGRDLSGVKIQEIDRKSAVEVATELDRRSRAMKEGHDPELAKAKKAFEVLPRRPLRAALRLSAWLAGDRAKSIRSLGVTASPFGSAMVTSVGMLGLPIGFAPLAWMYRVPLLVLVAEIVDKPVVVDGRVEVRPILPITATIDHRYVDGAHLGKALRAFRAYLERPSDFEPDLAIAGAGGSVTSSGKGMVSP